MNYIDNKENCSVAWRTYHGGIYQQYGIIRDVYLLNGIWYILPESGSEIPLHQLLSIQTPKEKRNFSPIK